MKLLNLPNRLAIAVAVFLMPATASAQKTLRYTDHEPLGGMRTRFIQDVFFAAVEKESNGRLKVQAQWDSAVATGYDALRVLGTGSAADIGIAVPEYSANELPLHQIFKSFPKGPTGDRQVAFFRRVYAEVPAFPAELKANNVVNIFFATGYPVALFSTSPLTSLTDMKGEKWRTASFWHRDFLQNAGATPVTMPWGAGVFNALQAKTLDGLIVNIDSGYMLNVHTAAPHVVASKDLWLGHVYLLVMNGNAWTALAPDDQAALQRAAETAYRSLGSAMESSFPAMVRDMEKEGVKIRLLTGPEVDAFEAATRYQDVQAAWVKAQEAKGVRDVAPTLEKVRAILKDSVK